MSPARWPRADRLAERLLHVDVRRGTLRDGRVGDLPRLLRAGDLLVVNDAATLPASLRAKTAAGAPVEIRLAAGRPTPAAVWPAVLFGPGDWRTRTEDRPAPPRVLPGDRLTIADELHAAVAAVSPLSPRLVDVRFDAADAALWTALYRHGRPVQYSYLAGPLELWHTQTSYAARPWAVEQPSAGRPLAWRLLASLPCDVAPLTHAAGLSSTGDPALDAALPLPEPYEIPAETVRAVEAARRDGGRVIAVGTTVVRALEGCFATHGALRPGPGVTDLRLSAAHPRRVVDGILTGVHGPGESHFALLEAFAPRPLLAAAHAHAEREGYLCHEFGDSCLIV